MKFIISGIFSAVIILAAVYLIPAIKNNNSTFVSTSEDVEKPSPFKDILNSQSNMTPDSVTTKEMTLPESKTLDISYHTYQTFNNCGPAALSITLSYYGINVSQQTLGMDLRPYQVKNGDNDDKSTTMRELADKATEYGFTTYFRPNGDINLLKKFIANDIPVITKTWLKPDEDIGHFRVVKGYNDNTGKLIQDDSLQGPNLWYSYEDFDLIWAKFGHEYVVLVPSDKLDIAKEILGQDLDENNSWKRAAEYARKTIEIDPNNVTARFNLVVALYYTGDYSDAVMEFEKIEGRLSPRTLWYQIEPIRALYEVGNYTKVLSLSDRILTSGNRAFSELYLIRGDIYKKQGKMADAKIEYDKALFYNKNMDAAKKAVESF